jgi:hypothetical protein
VAGKALDKLTSSIGNEYYKDQASKPRPAASGDGQGVRLADASKGSAAEAAVSSWWVFPADGVWCEHSRAKPR